MIPPQRARGFTLIELLVAVGVMALMAELAWRGIDGMTRGQVRLQQYSDEIQALQVGLAQWGVDLDSLAQLPDGPKLDWNGRSLRLVRRGPAGADDGLRVVAWSRHAAPDGSGRWQRWQSPPVRTGGELQAAWQQASQWSQAPSDEDRPREVSIIPLSQWQIFYFRKDAWSHPLSSAGGQDTSAAVPDGIRLVLTLPPGQAIAGTLTRDWIRPSLGGGK